MRSFFYVVLVILISACNTSVDTNNKNAELKNNSDTVSNQIILDLPAMLAKKEVPVLCYHHIRNFSAGESASMKSYSVTPAAFAEQMKTLHDSGYHTILPEQLYNYLVHDAALPAKPVMLTFDDTDKEQFTLGATEMNKYGFKGVFFLMTIAIDKKRYMSKEELKELADSAHAVEAHTWDHHMVTKYKGGDWDTQFVRPKKKIEEITGKPVNYFAYPFGLWNKEAIPELKKAGYKMAFILSTKRDSTEPLFTIRRMIVPGQWSTEGMLKAMKTTFNKIK